MLRLAFLLAVAGICVGVLLYGAERLMLRRTGHSWLIAGWSGLGPTIYDPVLGWTSSPSTHWPDLYGPGNDLTYNARGFRSLREYEDRTPEGRFRILCLGDSFTEGLGVDDRAVYTSILEDRWPHVEAVNMAKISYGTDQAILRYEEEASGMDADLVVLAVIGDDFRRTKWDRFNRYWPKPRFELRDGAGAELVGTPVPNFSEPIAGPLDFLRRSALFLLPRQFVLEQLEGQDGEALAFALLDRMTDRADERGQRVALAYLPTIDEARSGELLPPASWMERYADEHELVSVPVAQAFSERDAGPLYLEGNLHFSEAGHRLAAETFASSLALAESPQ